MLTLEQQIRIEAELRRVARLGLLEARAELSAKAVQLIRSSIMLDHALGRIRELEAREALREEVRRRPWWRPWRC